MSRRGNMVCFNVSGCEGIDEQLKDWLDSKLNMALDSTDDTAPLLGEEGVRMTELEALVATELGATCHAKVTQDVTHVVASAKATDKMHRVKHRQMAVCLSFHWKRAAEAKRPVTQKHADALLQEPIDDTAVAIAAAGGGRGLVQEAQ
ncbi:hypothetical protein WJX77_009999 [Trebouxia sp. C0004]